MSFRRFVVYVLIAGLLIAFGTAFIIGQGGM